MAKQHSFLNLQKLTFRVKETGQIHKMEQEIEYWSFEFVVCFTTNVT